MLKQKHNKGVAGLTILLSLITMLFVIGLLVMIFALMGGELQEATYDTGSVTVNNESGGYINTTGYTLSEVSNYKGSTGISVDHAYNVTNASNKNEIGSGNWSVDSNGVVTNATTQTWANVDFTYSFNYDESNDATQVIGNTTEGISNVTDWYSIFIVIGSMVVLILLTVIIITAIKGSGLMASRGTA